MSSLPDIKYTLEGYSYRVTPDTIRTEFYSGNTRQRALRKNRNDVFTVRHIVTNAQLSSLETFFQDTINNGADEFTAPYYVSDVEYSGSFLLLEGSYSSQNISPSYSSFSYNIEIQDRDMTNEEAIYDLVNALSGFESMYDLMQETEYAVNNNNL